MMEVLGGGRKEQGECGLESGGHKESRDRERESGGEQEKSHHTLQLRSLWLLAVYIPPPFVPLDLQV